MDPLLIRRDVAYSMREAVVRGTIFNYYDYSEDIIPSKTPLEGFEADVPFWGLILKSFERSLHEVNKDYSMFIIRVDDATMTLEKNLRESCNIFTLKIAAM